MTDAGMDDVRDEPFVSVVIPCYRSGPKLEELIIRLFAVLETRRGGFEVICVEDGSPDDTWQQLVRLRVRLDGRLRCLRLAQNVGQHEALLCGFEYLANQTTTVVTMDDDLQHPPEEIPKLLDALDDATDLVIAGYNHKKHSPWRNSTARVVDHTLRLIYRLPPDFELTSFRSFRRYVADHAVAMRTDFPYITAMVLSATTRRRNVLVRHEPRTHGRSGYDLNKAIRLALNLYFTYSSIPLYAMLALVAAAMTVTVGVGSWVVLSALFARSSTPGWASTIAIVSFASTMILAGIAILGISILRIQRDLTRTSSRRVAAIQ
jgi:glycosyltransferase involved in cell wall biosynthesis